MPIVYVHGVGNRPGDRAEVVAGLRDGLFRRVFLPVALPGYPDAAIVSPFWGGLGGVPRWGLASLPDAGTEVLGPEDEVLAALALGGGGGDAVLTAAQGSVPDAIDALFTLVDPGDDPAPLLDFAADAVRYCAEREALYPREAEPVRYPWLAEVRDDVGFLDRLMTEVAGGQTAAGGTEALGGAGTVRNRLAAGLRRLRRASTHRVTAPPVELARRILAPRMAMLLGDVLAYLARRGTVDEPGPIVRTVVEGLEGAKAKAATGEPIVVVAHSMGGSIVYDVLSHYRTDLRADVLVTVGAQVGLFEELKLFKASRPDVPDATRPRMPAPPGVGRWLNVVDRADPLAFRAGPVFDGAVDYRYPSGSLWAHTAYLRQPNFHARLGRRVADALS